MEQEWKKTLQQGLEDEMNSAVQYTQLAGQYGDIAVKKAFLGYAMEELRHAQKILSMFEEQAEEPDKVNIALAEQEDLFLSLVEYLAKEEAAIFYYKVLQELEMRTETKEICRLIKEEEEEHLQKIGALYQRLKSGELHGDE
ncbi:MAG: ferritin-like domain-containing protein [Peptococcaceae bacterium]|nr:ferritin-like domain-containing protein [Peptococcaceae bacterium]